MIPKDYRIFPDPTPAQDTDGVDPSQISDVFIVVYHVDGNEMMSFRKSFMDVKNVKLEELISLHPSNNFEAIEEEDVRVLRKKYLGE